MDRQDACPTNLNMKPLQIYAIDCGTTNWRIQRLNYNEQQQPNGTPERVGLSIIDRNFLPAAILLDEHGQAQCIGGEDAYEQAKEPSLRPLLHDRFKPDIGTKPEALEYTRLLLVSVLNCIKNEKSAGKWRDDVHVYFTHPVHWDKNGVLPDFIKMVRGCFPQDMGERIHFIAEPEAALLSMAQLNQLHDIGQKYTLVVDVGGGTTDVVVAHVTPQGLADIRQEGGAHGSGLYDEDLAHYFARELKLTAEETARL